MRTALHVLVAAILLGMAHQSPGGAADPKPAEPKAATEVSPTEPDELTLKAAGLASDGPALLEFFRARTWVEADRDQLANLVRQLGDATAEARDRTAAELVRRGA